MRRMVVRPTSLKPKASEAPDRESHPNTVAHPDNSQHFGQDEHPLSALPSDSVSHSPELNVHTAAASPCAAKSSSTAIESSERPARVAMIVGAQMPKQRGLFPELRPFELVAPDEPLLPERTKASFYEVLKTIQKQKSFRAVASLKSDAPIIVCLERIREALAKSGLTHQQIAELTGIKSRQTVSKILKVDPSVSLYDFCAVMNVIGLDIAELFPMRKRKPAARMQWPRGYHHSLENLQRQLNLNEEKRRRRKKRWG
jgi:transcriptional regulator with XRE-family HTH domain